MTFASIAAPAAPETYVEPRVRTRILFAAAFGTLTLLEAYVGFLNSVPADTRLYFLWRAFYWAAIDVALWWVCISSADAMTRGETTRALPYVVAAIAASAAAPWMHWLTGTWYFDTIPGRPPRTELFTVAWQISIIGACRMTLLTAGYYYRLRSLADASHLARSRLDHAMLSRKAVESQLHALQGKIDPNLLFETLDDIEEACEWDTERADRMLERLIAYLRGALPHTEEGVTVTREVALARAYLELVESRNPAVTHAIEVQDDAEGAAMTPMLLTPLVVHAVRAMRNAEGHVTITCAVEGERMRISIAARGAEGNALWQQSQDVADVAKRVKHVYGAAASLEVGTKGTDIMQITLRIPHEHAARNHR